MSVNKLREAGRDGLIRLAVEEVRKQAPDFDPQAFDTIRVRAKEGVLVVRFEMNVQVLPQGAVANTSAGPLQNTLDVTFTDREHTLNPDPRQLYPYTPAARAALRELEAAGVPVRVSAEILRIKVEDLGDVWVVTLYRRAQNSYTGGAEQYAVDKKTRTRTLRWHEHPMRLPGSGITGGPVLAGDEGGWVEIK